MMVKGFGGLAQKYNGGVKKVFLPETVMDGSKGRLNLGRRGWRMIGTGVVVVVIGSWGGLDGGEEGGGEGTRELGPTFASCVLGLRLYASFALLAY